MSRLIECRLDERPGFPRVSGDEPLAVSVQELAVRFSPRERG